MSDSKICLATAQLLSRPRRKCHRHLAQSRESRQPPKTFSLRSVLPSDFVDLAAALALGGVVKKYVEHLDGVFLNAGIAAFAPIESVTPKNYDDVFTVNVRVFTSSWNRCACAGQFKFRGDNILHRR